MTWEDAVQLGLTLPEVEVSTSYGTPALKVKGKLLLRLKEDGESAAVMDTPIEEREILVETRPDAFFFTDHYRDWPIVLVRLKAMKAKDLRPFLLRSWRARAPKSLQKRHPDLS